MGCTMPGDYQAAQVFFFLLYKFNQKTFTNRELVIFVLFLKFPCKVVGTLTFSNSNFK